MEDPKATDLAVPGCPGCARLLALVVDLVKRVEVLEERANRNSRNSHSPSSHDPPNAPSRQKKEPSGKKRGAQLGHEGHSRPVVPPEDVTNFVAYVPEKCEECGCALPKNARGDDPPPSCHQTFDLLEVLRAVTEYQAHARTCVDCGHVTRAKIPSEIRAQFLGPKLTATIAYLVGSFGLSRRQAEEIFEDLLGAPISLGSVSNTEEEVSEALEAPTEEVAEAVAEAPAKNVDETGWRESKRKSWLWAAATAALASFKVHPTRGKAGLRALLRDKLRGVFTTDRWSVYDLRARRRRQVCWSHLLRDFQKVLERGGESRPIGEEGLTVGGDLFLAWRDFKSGGIDRPTLQAVIAGLKEDLHDVLVRGKAVSHQKTVGFCENLLALESALWTFARVEGVEPTNNHAERVLRRAVLWRKRSFGSDSERGSRFAERMLTAVQTRRLQKLPVLSYILEAVRAHRAGLPAPSLLPA